EVYAESVTRVFEEARHAERKFVRDDGAFAEALADEIAEVFGFVVEAAVCVGFVEEDFAAVHVMHGGANWIPPVCMEKYVSAWRAEQGIATAEQIEAGVKLGHASLVLGLEDGEVIDTRRAEAAHGLDALERTEPVNGEKRLVRADAENAAAAELEEVEWVVGRERRVAMAGADESDRPDWIALQMLAKALVEREKGRLHGFHKEPVVSSRSSKDPLELAHVQSRGLFAEDVLARGERGDAEVGVGVRVGGDIDSVDGPGEQFVEGGSDEWGGKLLG